MSNLVLAWRCYVYWHNEIEISFWWNVCRWLHPKSLFCQCFSVVEYKLCMFGHIICFYILSLGRFCCNHKRAIFKHNLLIDSFKLRSHMRGAVAERRRADFDIPAPLPRVCSHIRGTDAGGSAISWGQRWFGARGFEADAGNWVLDPFVAERILLPLRLRAATAFVWTHVMICVEANFPPAPAPCMCERTFIVSCEIAFWEIPQDLFNG